MKAFSILALAFMLCFPMMAMARKDVGPPEWTFDDVTELADWQDHHDLDPATTIAKVKDGNGVERDVLRIVSSGDNPYIYPGGAVPSWEPFSGYDYETIYLGLRVGETDTWQVDYITSRNGSFDEGHNQQFRVEVTQGFVDIEFNMQWADMIRGFRIHPGTDRNRVTEIDYISLRGPVVVTESPRRLATTWGRIKDIF